MLIITSGKYRNEKFTFSYVLLELKVKDPSWKSASLLDENIGQNAIKALHDHVTQEHSLKYLTI